MREGAGGSQGTGLAVPEGAAKRAQAAVLVAQELPQEAAELALAAAEGAEALGARLEAARSRLLAGRCLSRAGARQRAVAELSRAAEVLADCGAARLLAEASAELRRLGRRPRTRRPREDSDGRIPGLSPRESEIAVLVAQGKSNRAMACELYLSERTVENHLNHIFTKLGVSSRTALFAALRSPGRTGG